MVKRKLDSSTAGDSDIATKRLKVQAEEEHGSGSQVALEAAMQDVEHPAQSTSRKRKAEDEAAQNKPKVTGHKVRKLVPPRPFPTVPASVSATGPRSAHPEGKNYICVTRRTELGAYLRRCKDVFIKDG